MLKTTATLALSLSLSAAAFANDWSIPSLPFKPAPRGEVVASFMKATLTNKALPGEQRAAVLKELEAAEKEGAGEYALTRALVAAYPDLGQALAAFADEQFDKAAAQLKALAKSEDAYLAAHAEFYLARVYMVEERYEEALPLFDKLAGDAKSKLTLHAGEALFYKAMCHDRLLERTEAIVALATYLRQNPDAPERLAVGAIHKIEELRSLIDGSLSDVEDRMEFSRRRLDLEKPDDPTQKEQTKIIAMLDKLIEEAEQKEKNSGGGGGGGGGGGQGQGDGSGPRPNQSPSGPAQSSQAPEGASEFGQLHRVNKGSAADSWGNLKKKERQAVIDAFKAKFPSRYRQAVEEYYKGLQESDK
jgi:tetratricopeptide (TPR) repeat protein